MDDSLALVATDAMDVSMPPLVESADGANGSYRWVVEEWSKIRTTKHRSEPFNIGGFYWRVLIFPKGNSNGGGGQDYLSLFLEAADPEAQPYGWARYASFSLTVLSQLDATARAYKDASHKFESREADWGFSHFLTLAEFHDPARGLIVNDTVIITCDVSMRKDFTPYPYDSRKETGFIGLKNQGATCYMNSLLQTLFHIPYFRKAVYHMPTTESDSPHSSIPLALQSLFYKVQFAENAVATKDLTRSFGWDAYDSFMQHDVQELNRVLCEKLDEKMKQTSVEGTIQKLFEGHTKFYINCVDVDCQSTRREAFLDLQLDVKGCKDVYASFDKYVDVEKMEGENKYDAEGHGLQDAEKGVLFTDFPPVLQLHLKRFEYDYQRDLNVKINDRYEFPEQLDLDAGDGKYLSPDADRSVRNKYLLHSVLVHSGGVNGGHYYAYIRPDLRGKWFKFDDERVTGEEATRALNDQYGGEDDNPAPGYQPGIKLPKYSNAYMLVYVRESDQDNMICEASKKDIATHLVSRLEKEQLEKDLKKKEKAEAHLYTVIKLSTAEDISKQMEGDHHFDLVDHEACRSFRVEKQTLFGDFKRKVATDLGVPVERQRYWLWARRQNHTFRPNRTLSQSEELLTVFELQSTTNVNAKTPLTSNFCLFLEVIPEHVAATWVAELASAPPCPDNDDFPARAVSGGGGGGGNDVPTAFLAPPVPAGHILLFFKIYDPRAETLRFLGHLLLDQESRMVDNLETVMRLAGPLLLAGEELAMFEEIKFEPDVFCEKKDLRNPLKSSLQLGDGDIICIQPVIPQAEVDKGKVRFGTTKEFMEFLHDRQRVIFRDISTPREDKFTLDLSKIMSYDAVTAALAAALGVADSSALRLSTHNSYTLGPKTPPLTHRCAETLADMLPSFHDAKDILYFEILDMPLAELERLKTLKVCFHGRDTKLVETSNIRIPRDSCVSDVLEEVRGKLGNKVTPGCELRLLEIYRAKIYKVLPGTEKIESIDDHYWYIRAEEVVQEEDGADVAGGGASAGGRGDHRDGSPAASPVSPGAAGGADSIIYVYHFYRDPVDTTHPNNNYNIPSLNTFGEPFLLRVGAEETLQSVKARVQVKLGVSNEEFDTWKWAFASNNRPEYLEDDDEFLAARFCRREAHSAFDTYLGMEHEDKHPRKTAAKNNSNNRYNYDQKSVKIYN